MGMRRFAVCTFAFQTLRHLYRFPDTCCPEPAVFKFSKLGHHLHVLFFGCLYILFSHTLCAVAEACNMRDGQLYFPAAAVAGEGSASSLFSLRLTGCVNQENEN